MWKSLFPPFQWLTGYSSGHLRSDAYAGLTLAAYAIPVSMAYASLAGLPVQYGIYGYLIGGVFYAFFGTGKGCVMACELDAESCGLSVDAVASSDADCVFMFQHALFEGGQNFIKIG